MGKRCSICGLLEGPICRLHNSWCTYCRSAYARFRRDPGWRGCPPGAQWFRYIVRERLMRGYNRYPHKQKGHDIQHGNIHWEPDRKPPWPDVNFAPEDVHLVSIAQAIRLGIIDVPDGPS